MSILIKPGNFGGFEIRFEQFRLRILEYHNIIAKALLLS